jgi:hypothetical protein
MLLGLFLRASCRSHLGGRLASASDDLRVCAARIDGCLHSLAIQARTALIPAGGSPPEHAGNAGSAIPIVRRVDPATIVDTQLPDLDQEWRPTVERLIEVVMGALPDAQHERKWGAS